MSDLDLRKLELRALGLPRKFVSSDTEIVDEFSNTLARARSTYMAQWMAATDPKTVLTLIKRLREAEAKVERVRAMHHNDSTCECCRECAECRIPGTYPCDTIKALDE